jgi:hypothetical protein
MTASTSRMAFGPAVHPGAAEYCDGADSDCDSQADADEDEVRVMGDVDVLVAHDDTSQEVLSASIAGFGEKATANPNSMFAVAWTHSFDDCKQWQTNLIANDAALTRVVRAAECLPTGNTAIDVVAQPEVLTVVAADSVTPRTYYVVSSTKSVSAGSSLRPTVSLSFKDSEYRLLYLHGTARNTVRRLGYSRDLERTRDDIVDPEGEHIAVDGAQGSAVWTLRESPTLDRVYADMGDGVVLARVNDGSGDELSEPKIAVTGSYLRALWKRVTGDGTALESRQFRWDECG